jgi:misacylated tRNA(Ala) deacylase
MVAVFRNDAYARSCSARVVAAGPDGVRLDRTVFYPTGGGQPGDRGMLTLADGTRLTVIDAVKGDAPDDVLHKVAEGSALPQVGAEVTAEIDWDLRYRHMRMHTALHLICAVVDAGITGAQVGAEKSRIDLNWPEPDMTKDEITARLSEIVAADHPVRAIWISDEELAAKPELVRSMSVSPPTGFGQVRLLEIERIDLQACGGTHVASTGEIGAVEIAKIENKGKQNRRLNVVLRD